MARIHQQVDVLDLIPYLPSGTTGSCRLVREGRTVTVHSSWINTTGSGMWPTISLPSGWAPAYPCLLLAWPWDTTALHTMQWEGAYFRAGSAISAPRLGSRMYLAGSWVV